MYLRQTVMEINDGFFIRLQKHFAVAQFSCVIVDRWGVTMYENDKTSLMSGNGTDKKTAAKCNDGVYFLHV
jgi:hypothetical protein